MAIFYPGIGILILGSAGGIGLTMAILFTRLGTTIVSCSKDAMKMAVFKGAMVKLNIRCFTRVITIPDADCGYADGR